METNYIHIRQNDGYQTRLFYYNASTEAVLGNVLILHGMAEHHDRYLSFIQALCKEGFDVYAYDHRGHGTDKKLSELGFIANHAGASIVTEDAITVCRHIKENGRSDKLAVFGHSMGSLILRCVIQQYHDLDAAIFSSSTMPPLAVSYAGIFVSNLTVLFKGPKKRSNFLNNMMFGGKPYTSLCVRTKFDWLTRNNTLVGKYMDDSYCGFLCTSSFYRDLATLCKHASVKRNVIKARKDQPILFLTGDKDPVGGNAKQILKLQQLHDALGFTAASTIIYPEARHELLNELNAEEVIQDIFTFLHKNLA